MNFKELLLEELERIEDVLNRAKELSHHFPAGRLSMQKRGKHKYYKRNNNGHEQYLKHNDPMIQKLKDKHFTKVVEANVEYDQKAIRSLIDKYREYDPNLLMKNIDNKYLPPSSKVIEALGFIDEKEFEKFTGQDSKYKEDLRHNSLDGVKMRSKSEISIAGIYASKGIPAVYEMPLRFPDGTVMRPDFTVWVRSKRRYMYHEHIGMLNDRIYLENQVWKFKKYIEFGYFPFSNILYTFDDENGNIDNELISHLIDLLMV